MNECKACGHINSDENQFCEKCGTNLNAIVCPNCNIEIYSKDISFCPNCGYDIASYRNSLWLLDNDEELKKQDAKYVRLGVIQYASLLFLGVGIFAMYQTLENNWQDSIGIFGMILIALSLPIFIISTALRIRKGKQIKTLLQTKQKRKEQMQ